eukprot:2598769-Alexandrium_andersonii.AAC.1
MQFAMQMHMVRGQLQRRTEALVVWTLSGLRLELSSCSRFAPDFWAALCRALPVAMVELALLPSAPLWAVGVGA